MAFDTVIRGGTLVDGTGTARYTADIALKDGLIAEIGKGLARGREEIDASGAIVTPGFVDIHTHYDGQVAWDPDFMPSSVHGVTTAVMGSCGVGFAPVRPDMRDQLIRVFEGVEDIPGSALHEGLPDSWESYPQYLDSIESLPHSIDFASHVTHDALRVYVMGERAMRGELANQEDRALMRALAREGVEAGAVGISAGRTSVHVTADGAMTPGYDAGAEELVELASALRGLDHGVLQIVSDFRAGTGLTDGEVDDSPEANAEWQLMRRMVEASGRHPLSVSVVQAGADPEGWRTIVRWIEGARAEGLPMRFQTGVRGVGLMMGLQTTLHPLLNRPSYRAMMDLPLAERARRLSDAGLKAKILAEAPVKIAGPGTGLPEGVDTMLPLLAEFADRLFELDDHPDYEPAPERSVGAKARARGLAPMDLIYDLMLEDEGRNLLYFPVYNYMEMNLNAVHDMLSHPAALAGLSDGGAHVATICDASYSTTLLGHWARDRSRGPKLGLEHVVRLLTSETARHLGMADRGILEPSLKADINVIDPARVRNLRPYIVSDLPAGGKRFLQKADGYIATLVSGTVIARNGELTGARPGRLYRAGRASPPA